MFGLGAQELIVILLIALVLFGGAKIPELGRSLGQAIREFKKATREVTDEIQNAGENTQAQQPRTLPSSTPRPADERVVSQSSPSEPKA